MVDDNELNLMALKSTIEAQFDAEVQEAVNGKVALDVFLEGIAKECNCENRVPSLVFMDI